MTTKRGELPEVALIRKWQDHAEQAGHDLNTAQYDRNYAGTYIMCCEPGCDWQHPAGGLA